MMTPQQLERASQAYRRGYREGYASKVFNAPQDSAEGPFGNVDYCDGYAAGKNERRLDDNAKRFWQAEDLYK